MTARPGVALRPTIWPRQAGKTTMQQLHQPPLADRIENTPPGQARALTHETRYTIANQLRAADEAHRAQEHARALYHLEGIAQTARAILHEHHYPTRLEGSLHAYWLRDMHTLPSKRRSIRSYMERHLAYLGDDLDHPAGGTRTPGIGDLACIYHAAIYWHDQIHAQCQP